MKCPYNRKKETRSCLWSQKPSDENETVMKSGKDYAEVYFELMECEKENCSVWRKGKCNYAAVDLNNE